MRNTDISQLERFRGRMGGGNKEIYLMSINYVQKLALLSSQMWVWIDSMNELLSYILLETKGLRG